MNSAQATWLQERISRELSRSTGTTVEVRLFGRDVAPATIDWFQWATEERALIGALAWRHMMQNPTVRMVVVFATPDQRDGEPFGFLDLIDRATVADVVQLLGVRSARDVTIHPWFPKPRAAAKWERLDEWTIATGNALARGVDREISVRRALADELEAAGARRAG